MANIISKEDVKYEGKTGTPDEGMNIIMWNYDDSPEITEWKYTKEQLTPLGRWVFDDSEPGEGGMTYLDSIDKELEDELGHPTFEEALKKYPYWDVENETNHVVDVLDEYANYDFNEKFGKCQFYSYYASYFINDDDSGMTEDEIEDCEAFLEACKEYFECDYVWVTDVLDDSDFGDVEIPKGWRVKSYNGVEFLPGDVCTYLIQKSNKG